MSSEAPLDGRGNSLHRQIGLGSATLIVVASMIGQGIFTGPGYIGASLQHPGLTLALWALGGVVATAGALCYAELGTLLPRAGGEYAFIRAAFGPVPAFLCGWGCFLGGFSAPIALCALTFSEHLGAFIPSLSQKTGAVVGLPGGYVLPLANVVAASLIAALTVFHVVRVSSGVRLQDVLTLLKGAVLALLLAAALISGRADASGLAARGDVPRGWSLVTACATNLIYITLAYAGWNGATYIAGEVREPRRVIPRATVWGTLIVTAVYLTVNVIYLLAVPVTRMEAAPNIALLASEVYFGQTGRRLTSLVIAVTQLATISAFVLTGSRVYYAMGEDGIAPRRLARVDGASRTPRTAVALQGGIAIVMALSSEFYELAQYAGTILSAFSALALASLIVLRRRQPNLRAGAYRAPGGNFLPLSYLAFTVWMLVFFLRDKASTPGGRMGLWIGLASLVSGLPVYALYAWRQRTRKRAPVEPSSGRS